VAVVCEEVEEPRNRNHGLTYLGRVPRCAQEILFKAQGQKLGLKVLQYAVVWM
jgi:hypothetical protein